MNENLLSPCRACGKMISKNLVSIDTHRGSDQHTTIRSGSCPNCGEVSPHLTQEDIERIREQERNTKKLHEANLYELEKQAKKQAKRDKIINWLVIYPMCGLFISLLIFVGSCMIFIFK